MKPLSSQYSVIIPSLHLDKDMPALKALRELPEEERPHTVLISVGKNPSYQRNLGVQKCETPLIYFLDDDSRVIPGGIPHLVSHFGDGRTAVAGGPNLVPYDASSFEKTANSVMASWMGSFKVRARYAAIGSVRESDEKELILCNLMVRREAFLKEGGFRNDLYPNEENEFLNRLMHKGYALIYDPRVAIYRSRRKSLKAFCIQAFRYGRGRAQQMKVYPCLSDMIHLAPTFFVLYLLTLFTPVFVQGDSWWLQVLRSPLYWLPFGLFLVLSIGTGISAASWNRQFMDVFKVPFLILYRHFFYGIGLVTGLVTNLTHPNTDVKLYQVRWRQNECDLIPLEAE